MPGAGKKRGKIDKKNGTGPAATEQPAAEDGPLPPAGRGRPADNPAPSGSRDISVAASAAGPLRDPARDAAVFLNRNVDFAGNAYNLINKVSAISQKPFAVQSLFFAEPASILERMGLSFCLLVHDLLDLLLNCISTIIHRHMIRSCICCLRACFLYTSYLFNFS